MNATENLTTDQWSKKIEEYDITLAGSPLEPAIRTAVEKLRADAIQRRFLAEVTAPTVNVDAAQQFVTPKVPETMPPSVAENLKMWDGKIAEVEAFLQNAPPHHLIAGSKEVLAEYKESRARVLYNFQNPEPIPVPAPPKPIALPPEVIELVQQIVRAEVPSIIAQTIAWFKANPDWLRS